MSFSDIRRSSRLIEAGYYKEDGTPNLSYRERLYRYVTVLWAIYKHISSYISTVWWINNWNYKQRTVKPNFVFHLVGFLKGGVLYTTKTMTPSALTAVRMEEIITSETTSEISSRIRETPQTTERTERMETASSFLCWCEISGPRLKTTSWFLMTWFLKLQPHRRGAALFTSRSAVSVWCSCLIFVSFMFMFSESSRS